MINVLAALQRILWGTPMLVLIIGTGLYLSIRTGWAQIRLFPNACRCFFQRLFKSNNQPMGISSFQALCTALAATVGTGNLVGVAGAICLGGPGSVFWMWICGLFAMITKYAEVTLAVFFREKRNGEFHGGPMYMISNGLGSKWEWLASAYCLFGIVASFGIGNMAQINAVISGINQVFFAFGQHVSSLNNLGIGFVLAALTGATIIGGAKRIARLAEGIVPVAAAGYIILCTGVLILKSDAIPDALFSIVRGAFSPEAVTGGVIGSSFKVLSVGCSRGIFTNEAGMGTASIAHASAETKIPAEQGFMGIVEVFLDTMVICTLTALAILTSGISIPYGKDFGGELALQAFSLVYGSWSTMIVSLFLVLFAFATVLGWGMYGARCAEFLFGSKILNAFHVAQIVAVLAGSVLNTKLIWLLSEIMNGLMAIPNLIALTILSPELIRLTNEYRKSDSLTVSGGNYADFYQRKSLRAFSYAKVSSLRSEGRKSR